MTKPTRLLPCRDEVAIDDNHINLIASLVACSKPKSILELGIGSGATTSAILEAIEHNGNGALLTCVDNFLDWNGETPDLAFRLPVNLVNSSEQAFVSSCQEKFDFIVSDADHDHSHEWASVTMGLLNDGGIAVFHDVMNPDYKNLLQILGLVCFTGMKYKVFDKSSREDERCNRGLLVVFK